MDQASISWEEANIANTKSAQGLIIPWAVQLGIRKWQPWSFSPGAGGQVSEQSWCDTKC